jgi:hypothetical protein
MKKNPKTKVGKKNSAAASKEPVTDKIWTQVGKGLLRRQIKGFMCEGHKSFRGWILRVYRVGYMVIASGLTSPEEVKDTAADIAGRLASLPVRKPVVQKSKPDAITKTSVAVDHKTASAKA